MVNRIHTGPLSLSGVEMQGDNLMRFVYMDEAGISASEPLTVVAGVIVNADRQLALAETRIQELLVEYLPDRALSHFHATDIFSGRKLFHRPQYPLERAIELLKALASIPREFDLPVALAAFHKTPLKKASPAAARDNEAMTHGIVFSLCAMMAERYIREKAGPSEVGKLVAENNTTTQQSIKNMQEMMRGEFRTTFRQNVFNLFAGATENSLPLTKIRTSVFFASKDEEPMLQIADVVAFFVRRFYEGKTDIDQFMDAIMGGSSRPPAIGGDVGGISTIIGR